MTPELYIDDSERRFVESNMSYDMSRLEILTRRRVKFLGFTIEDEEYDWPVARIVVDGEEERIWYDCSFSDGGYWCEEMGVSGSLIDIAWGLSRGM